MRSILNIIMIQINPDLARFALADPFPRSLYVVYSNPLEGGEEALDAWYEDVHIPDSLDAGLFDSVRRYRALDGGAARFLTLWDCRYASEEDALAAVRPVAEGLRTSGRIEVVQEVVFQQFVFLEASLDDTAAPEATGLLALHSTWSRPAAVAGFDTWLETHAAQAQISGARAARYGVPDPKRKALVLVEGEAFEAGGKIPGTAEGLPPFGAPTPIFEGGSPAPSPKDADPDRLARLEGTSDVWASRWELISRR